MVYCGKGILSTPVLISVLQTIDFNQSNRDIIGQNDAQEEWVNPIPLLRGIVYIQLNNPGVKTPGFFSRSRMVTEVMPYVLINI